MRILNRLKHSGRIVVDCGRSLNRSSTVAGSGSFLYITNTVRGGGHDATVLNRTSTVSNRGRIVSTRSATVANRSAGVMNRRISVDESCRHRRSIVTPY